MSHYQIEISANNPAFAGDNFGPEIARILTEAAEHAAALSAAEQGEGGKAFYDSNGYRCAWAIWLTDKP